MKRTIFFLFSFCTIVNLSGCNTPDSITDIANYLEELDAEEKFSGVVLIAKDGEPIFERAYGIANRNFDVPNQLDTKFNLGSMNMMFTAVAILQLVEQGLISVDDKIIEHIPGYPNQEVADLVTIHQLLTHTSGMMDFISQEWREISKDQIREIDDYLPFFVSKRLLFEPGTQSSYSNAGFIVLGMIIEQATGQTYFAYVKENIYQPCGMANTDSFEVDRVVPNIAIGYAGNIRHYGELASNVYWLPFKGSSAAGGYSTAGDMLKFSNCLLNHQLLSPEFTDILLEDKVNSPIPGMEGNYAYGFGVHMINNRRVVGHGGILPGVCSNLDIFIDLGYTVVVLSNSSYDCIRVILKIRETLLN
ncbi:MAG: beta-lactamase family protein [Anaerolineales bacterium]|nr:beta-lactamase family protein [Anaerolineales bacterium]